MNRRPTAYRWLLPLCALFGLAILAAGWRSHVLAGDEGLAPAGSDIKLLVRREGTQLRDAPGRFSTSGNRVVFTSADGATYFGLENLNLQRVAKVVAGSPEAIEWFVTGTLTEYQGSNYLLLSHARRKASSPKTSRGF